MLTEALVARPLDLTRGKIDREERAVNGVRARGPLRPGTAPAVPEAAVGDVADDDDASLLRAIDQQWLTRSSYQRRAPSGSRRVKSIVKDWP